MEKLHHLQEAEALQQEECAHGHAAQGRTMQQHGHTSGLPCARGRMRRQQGLPGIEELPVAHIGRADALTGAAAQTVVDCGRDGLIRLDLPAGQGLQQRDAPAWGLGLFLVEGVGGAVGQAQPAFDTAVRFRLHALRLGCDFAAPKQGGGACYTPRPFIAWQAFMHGNQYRMASGRLVGACLLAGTAFGASAEDAAEAAKGWSGDLAAGFVAASGNSESRSANASAALTWDTTDWVHHLSGKALNTTDEGDRTVERYTAGYKLDFNFTEADFAFVALSFEKDLFGGVRERTSETVGYGRRLIDTDRHALNVELGGGLRQIEFQEPEGAQESEGIGRFGLDYEWKIAESNKLRQQINVETGSANTSTESITELRLSVVGNLFAVLSYTVLNNSDVGPGDDKTDTYTALNLSYRFGTP